MPRFLVIMTKATITSQTATSIKQEDSSHAFSRI